MKEEKIKKGNKNKTNEKKADERKGDREELKITIECGDIHYDWLQRQLVNVLDDFLDGIEDLSRNVLHESQGEITLEFVWGGSKCNFKTFLAQIVKASENAMHHLHEDESKEVERINQTLVEAKRIGVGHRMEPKKQISIEDIEKLTKQAGCKTD